MRKIIVTLAICMVPFLMGNKGGCTNEPRSASGVNISSVKVQIGPDGKTTEQRNVADRLLEDNKPGSIKHLYIISAYSGQVIIYSTIRGKVTSGGKRLTPTSVAVQRGTSADGFGVKFGSDNIQYTGEVLQDDGTYGSSSSYIFWFDVRGAYHQHYIAGGQIVHVSDQPMAWPKIILNLESVE